MKKNIKYLVSSALISLTFSLPQSIYGMEDPSKPTEQKKPSSIQLTKGSGDTLETVLGSGNNILLKMDMNLGILKAPLDKEQTEVPIRLFFTDFTSCPTGHPAVDFTVKVDCESTPLTCVLPDKPQFFDSYGQFTDWLNQGYFKNKIMISYNFHVDVQKLAPFLAQYLFAISPNDYHFIGTHVIEASLIKPDQCDSQVTWHSQRGIVNATTAMIQGIFYHNKQPYSIDTHHQIFSHPMIEQKVFKKDQTKKFYYRNWLAQSQITVKATYEEFPRDQINEWPNAPCQTYSLLRQKPGDLKEICHKACWDGLTGESLDIPDGKIFMMDFEDIIKKSSDFLESIVIDEKGKHFIMRYLYPETEEEKNSLRPLEEEAERLAIAGAVRREEVKAEKKRTEKRLNKTLKI